MDENNDELKGGGKGELPKENDRDGKLEYAEPVIQSKDADRAESVSKSKVGKFETAESLGRSKYATIKKAEKIQQAKGPPKRKRTVRKPKTSGVAQLGGRFRSFGATVKKLWGVWGRFKTKNVQDPHPSVSEKTLGVPGFEEIACIEAEVPDIMMTDKDRVRTSCKECMKDPPIFPSKEQIKAKLIAADKYYGVQSDKIKMEQSDTILEHEADYHDVDGTVVRPSWRFILERPLVEQYVLMTNYIRKVSVLSELKEDKHSKYIEEEDSSDDTEYRKFEQKFIKEKRELLKPMLKPKTQDMAVQTSSEPKQHSSEDLKESVSEISLYPESEDSTNSPEASAVTIVTSRDYTSPLQSDFDGRTTDKSTSYRGGKWWESEATCQPSESFQTSYDSINKNTSSGSDSQPVPIHSTWGNTTLQNVPRAFSNESDSQVAPRSRSVEPATHRRPKDSKKVSFSPVVTYYQGPNKNGAVYTLPDDEETAMEKQVELQQQGIAENPTLQIQITENTPEDRIVDENHISPEEIPKSVAEEKPKLSNKKAMLGNILQDKKPGQIVSVSLPDDWSENRVLHNKRMMNVVVSRSPAVKQPVSKRVSFQEYEEIPDVEHSESQFSTVHDRTDANIQTQTSVAPRSTPTEKCKPIKRRESSPPKESFDDPISQNTRPRKIQPTDNNPSTAQIRNYSSPVIPQVPNTKVSNAVPNLSRWLGCEGTESKGTETVIQSPPPRLISARPTSETPKRVKQKVDDYTTKPVSPEKRSSSDTAIQSANSPNTNTQTQVTLVDNTIEYRPRLKDTGDTHPRNVPNVLVRPSSNPDQKPVNHISRISHSPQYQSTDTEGPSSSSNEHIKLKASPACFFKVATPPDLSKISVDEFYPDVPEIDAELSQISETKTSSAPCVEIVFANKETALRCMQDAEFHRVSKKEENTILQRSKTEDGSPFRSNAPNKGRTITASAGVRIKIDAGNVDTTKDNGQSKSSYIAGKSSTRNSSQQSTITQCLGKSSVPAKRSPTESEQEPIILKETLWKTALDLGSAPKQATLLDDEENQTGKFKEVNPTNTVNFAVPIPDDFQNEKDIVAREKVKLSPAVTTELKSKAITPTEKTDCLAGSYKKTEEASSYENIINDTTTIETSKGGIEKRDGTDKSEQLANDDDDDTEITLQRQVESIPIDPLDQVMLQGRTKLYMRTLSSLAEETSSVMESTSSSTQDKLIEMPVTGPSVEELKTIFEKKLEVVSMSGESEMQVEESHSDPKKCKGLSKEKLENDQTSGKLISAEIITPVDDAKMTATENHLQHELDKKLSCKIQDERLNSQGKENLLPDAVEFDDSNAKNSTCSKKDTAKDGKPVRSEGSSHNENNRDVTQEESSVQQLSQIDVIRASEIYSNTSMYFSSSEDRVAKLSKARTLFQPVTLDDDLVSSSCSRGTERTADENQDESNKSHPGPSKNVVSKEKQTPCQMNKGPKSQQQGPKLKTNDEGDNFSVGRDSQQTPADTRRKLGKEKGETEETHSIVQELPSGSRTNSNEGLHEDDRTNPTTKTKSRTDDTSKPSETKHWLMDVIPILSKNTRFHGFRPHKPVCVREVTEAEAVKYRQEAVKPVFRFLKRQRDLEENKD